MYKVISNNGNIAYDVQELCCDTPEDLNALPTSCAMGSVCLVISTSEVYMLNSQKEWVKL